MEQNHRKTELFAFGPFILDITEALLTRSGEAVWLAPKELDLLAVLVRRAGHLVQKETLIAEVWPDTFVSDSSLLRTVSVLRKHLGYDSIQTVPKRGYIFVLPVVQESSKTEPAKQFVIPVYRQSVNSTHNDAETQVPKGLAIAHARNVDADCHSGKSLRMAILAAALTAASVGIHFLAAWGLRQNPTPNDQAVALHSEAAKRLCKLAWSYSDKGTADDRSKAILLFRHGTRAYPEDPRTWAGLSDSLALADEDLKWDIDHDATISEAELAVQRAIALGPNLPEAHLAAGTVYWQVGNRKEADWEYRRALELNPDFNEAVYRRASLLAASNRLDEAKQQYDRALRREPSSIKVAANAGDLYARLGLYDQALHLLHRALNVNDDSVLANGNLGLVFVRMHRYSEADAAFQKARKLTGALLPYGAAEAYCLARLGRIQPARNILTRVLLEKRGPRMDGLDLGAVATIYAGLNDDKMALKNLEQALILGQVSAQVAESSPYFESLRQRPEFSQVIGKSARP